MKRPRITINVAMTVDGKIDTMARKGAKISSDSDWRRVDILRAQSDAILVGGNTLTNEDPRLTIKDQVLRLNRVKQGLPENPTKIGVISNANIPLNSRFIEEGKARVLLFTTHRTKPKQVNNFKQHGVEVYILGQDRVDLKAMVKVLYDNQIRNLLVEGGGTINSALFRERLVDEILIYVAPMIVGGASAPTLADGLGFQKESAVPLHLESISQTEEEGVILHYFVIN